MSRYPKVAQFKDVASFRTRLRELELDLPADEVILPARESSPLAAPLSIGNFQVGNRWCIHPMEGWDCNGDGSPGPHTRRRWERFGLSGAKLIWGGEAAAVRPDGRANPQQLLATPENLTGLQSLLETLLSAHHKRHGQTGDLLVGLQLTHSGRFCRPSAERLEPRIAYHHPLLDEKFGIDPEDDTVLWRDHELEELIDAYVQAAGVARKAGFGFVDVKACHGYLLHEFLSARARRGRFGGDFKGRTRLLTTIVKRVRDAFPDLMVGVRLSVFDLVPYESGEEVGEPMPHRELLPYRFAFGVDSNHPTNPDLRESIRLIGVLEKLRVAAVNLSCGSPYYNPHIQRPAIFPPSDGYSPPEDPLVGVARQIHAARACKQAYPSLPMVGSGYTYLQDYLPHVAQAVIREGWIDFVGLGRMVLAYPELPADVLTRGKLRRRSICRTFSDCTTGPRQGMVSGCYPLDPYYKNLPEADRLRQIKRRLKSS